MTDFIYLIQEREFIIQGSPVYKIGRTCQSNGRRIGSYPKGSVLELYIRVSDCKKAEVEIIALMHNKFKFRPDLGAEYFEGDKYLMIDLVWKYVYFTNYLTTTSAPIAPPATIIEVPVIPACVQAGGPVTVIEFPVTPNVTPVAISDEGVSSNIEGEPGGLNEVEGFPGDFKESTDEPKKECISKEEPGKTNAEPITSNKGKCRKCTKLLMKTTLCKYTGYCRICYTKKPHCIKCNNKFSKETLAKNNGKCGRCSK